MTAPILYGKNVLVSDVRCCIIITDNCISVPMNALSPGDALQEAVGLWCLLTGDRPHSDSWRHH